MLTILNANIIQLCGFTFRRNFPTKGNNLGKSFEVSAITSVTIAIIVVIVMYLLSESIKL